MNDSRPLSLKISVTVPSQAACGINPEDREAHGAGGQEKDTNSTWPPAHSIIANNSRELSCIQKESICKFTETRAKCYCIHMDIQSQTRPCDEQNN